MRQWVLIGVLAIAGCQAGVAPEPDPIATPEPSQAPAAGTQHARLAALAEKAVRQSPDLVERVDHTPGVRAAALAKNRSILNELRRTAQLDGEYQYRSYDPFRSSPKIEEFAALALLAQWSAEAAIAETNWPGAIEDSLALARLGGFLTGGDTRAATTGLAFQDRAFHLLARVQRLAPADKLASLEGALAKLESQAPDPAVTLRNEAEQAQLVLEHFRALARKEKWGEIGQIVQPVAAGRLAAFRNLSPQAQDQALRSLAGEVSRHSARLAAEAVAPLARRKDPPRREKGPAEPFWPHAVRGMEAYIALRDRVLTESRLLRLHVWAGLAAHKDGSVPPSVTAAPEGMREDPFTGRPLLYVPAGREAKVYSPGPDRRDDGGNPATDVVLDAD
ncbi:MAG: hypothetical protein AB7F50_03595 [Fimbriimonadaceae bacterium]